MADLCFQMYAEVADVDQLLDMIRGTVLTDYIRFFGETQSLQLMNPGAFFQTYLMPDVPRSLTSDEVVTLSKGYYKGVVFNIPGVEVLINGEWIAYDQQNESLIMSQNPFNLKWRLNGKLLLKLGFKNNSTISGTIIAVDDQWNGMNLNKPITISIQ